MIASGTAPVRYSLSTPSTPDHIVLAFSLPDLPDLPVLPERATQRKEKSWTSAIVPEDRAWDHRQRHTGVARESHRIATPRNQVVPSFPM